MEPTVSVIIPAYNVAPYIGETLQSVFAQTFTDYEVIAINDGSPDVVEFEEAQGKFTGARNAFKKANKHYRKAKLTLAILLLRLSPRLLSCLYT